MQEFFAIIVSSLVISSVSFSGALLLSFGKKWTQTSTRLLVSFAAGVMLAVSFFDLLPEAFEQSSPDNLFTAVFTGIVIFFLFERFLLWFHHHDSQHEMKPAVMLVLFGDAIHNVIDGVAITAAYMANPVAGIITTFAMAAHEIPQEIADYSILVSGGLSKKKAVIFNFLSGLTAMVSAILSYFYLSNISRNIPLLLAFTAGMFIYISCSDLIPEMHKDFERQKSWIHTLPFVLGICTIWIVTRLLHFG